MIDDPRMGVVACGMFLPDTVMTAEAIAAAIAAPAAATHITGKDFDPNTFRVSRSNYQDGMAICDQFVNGDGYETFIQIPDYSRRIVDSPAGKVFVAIREIVLIGGMGTITGAL